MTSEADEYEALSVEVHASIHCGGHVAGGALLRDHVEAKLAEVRAERDAWEAAWKASDRRLIDSTKAYAEALADRDRTIAEQAKMLERLREALSPFANCCDQIADDEDDEEWAKFRLLIKDYRCARTALQETADAK
jgi:hypothetical protein